MYRLSGTERAKVRNQAVGFIFQAFNLIGDLTVYENVELPLTYRGMSPRERKERAVQALRKVLRSGQFDAAARELAEAGEASRLLSRAGAQTLE